MERTLRDSLRKDVGSTFSRWMHCAGAPDSSRYVSHPTETCAGFRVQGSGFRVQGSGFRVQGSGFRRLTRPGTCPIQPRPVQGSGFRVQGSGFRVQGSGFRRLTRPGTCPTQPRPVRRGHRQTLTT